MFESLKSLIRKIRGGPSDETWKAMRASQFGSASSVNTTTGWYGFESMNTVPSGDLAQSDFVDRLPTRDARAVAEGKRAIEDVRIEKRPVDVVAEVLTTEPSFPVNAVREQIRIVEWRVKVVKRYHGDTEDEEQALRYLRARELWTKHGAKFAWPIATDETIAALLAKYKLSNVKFSEYSKTVPMEATMALEKFGDAWDLVCRDRQPEVRLIIGYVPEPKRPKPDPILLASSPFGKWWYVLGAWDKEVEIVDEIVYRREAA